MNANIIYPENLPKMPVPPLQQTLSKYLQTVKPFMNEDELENTKEIVSKFEHGIGKKLQRLLEERASVKENWLYEWWLKAIYLQYRKSVVLYTSPGQVFPLQEFRNDEDRIQYAVNLVQAALSYKIFLDSGKIEVEKMGNEPIDMSQYYKIFGTCRIPGIEEDTLEFHPSSKHIIVARHNTFYTLTVLDNNNQIINAKNLSEAFRTILEDKSVGHKVGVLTVEHRDVWRKVHQELIRDSTNFQSVEKIKTSLFMVCLDNPMPKFKEDNRHTTASKQVIHGGGSEWNSVNRWFDKTLQFLIGEDGIVGLTYEHTPCEGQPIAILTDHLVEIIEGRRPKITEETNEYFVPTKLTFNINDNIKKAIHDASNTVDRLAQNLELNCFKFKSFGKDFVKSKNLSPDSFIQMALQYTYYRIHKTPRAQYEPASLRKFIYGRIEAIRSCSMDSINFARTMLDSTKNDTEKLTALQHAINNHKKYCVEAHNGCGVDRHLLGLKMIALENGLELPDIFKDVAFTRSSRMILYASQVASKCDGFMCFGPKIDDGYVCCYNPRTNDINFACATLAACPETNVNKFKEALEESLKDMHDLLVKY